MRKILFLSTVILISLSLQAQEKTETTIRAQGSLNTSTFLKTNRSVSTTYGYVYGYSFGLNLHKVYASQWGWEGGLNFIQKGGKFNNTLGNPRVHLGYLEGNFAALRNFPLENNDDVFVNAGLIIGGGITGKIKSDSSKINVPYGDEWKRIDVGVQFKTGYTFHKTITLGLFIDISLSNAYLQKVVPGGRPGINGKNLSMNVFGSISLNKLFHIEN
ncbi:MAG: outer membrane beta-barrel protein [Bacteroidota bacterium]